jgi:hypothetical protein
VLIARAAEHGFTVTIDEATDQIEVHCDGQKLTGLIADRITDLVKAKQGFQTLERFVHKAKAVRNDYYDHHSRTIKYALGTTVAKDRRDFDPDPRKDCSNGLHVGGRKYVDGLFAHSNSRILIVKVDPADWVAVHQYDHGKARVCRMYVYAENTPPRDGQRAHRLRRGLPRGRALPGRGRENGPG